MQRQPTVLISGAGIAGPALAYWLVRRGFRAVIVERATGLRTGGHAVDIRGTALEVIERMGLDAVVRDARTNILTPSIVRGDGRSTYDVALRPLREMRGDREVEIMRDDLARILFEAIRNDVEVVFGDSVRALVPDGDGAVGVEFERGAARQFDLVVGADGQHSNIRTLAFGPERDCKQYLGAYLSIFTIDNVLGIRDRAMLYNEPGRGAAVFTARGNERAKAVLLFRSPQLAIDFRDQSAQHALLAEQFAGMGWETARLLETMRNAYDFYFDEVSQIRLANWSAKKVVLLGDAAFGPSPMSGQGTSLALIGAHLLAHELAISSDIRSALLRWEQRFRDNVVQNQQLAIHGMKMLVPGSRSAIAVRNQMMRLLPTLARLGLGFGGRIERASRAVELPADPPVPPTCSGLHQR